jgi:hypothetical protein
LRKERAAELQLPGIRDDSAEFGGARPTELTGTS